MAKKQNAEQSAVAEVAAFKKVTMSGTKLIFSFGNGERRVFDTASAPDTMKERAMIHGFNQKISDGTSGYTKTKDYAGALAEVDAIIGGIERGEWNRTGGGQSGVNMQYLARALAEIRNVAESITMRVVEAATPEKRAEWAKNAKVNAHITRYKAEDAAKNAVAATDEELPTFDDE